MSPRDIILVGKINSYKFKLVKTTFDEAMPFMSPICSLTLGTQAQILDQAL